VYSPVWNGTAHATTEGLTTGTAVTVAVRNNGNAPVYDPIITVTAGTAAITALTVTVGTETALSWAGTLGAGNDLVIDCGAQTIRNDGTDAYSGFSYGAGHTVGYWVGLGATATTTISISHTGGVTGVVEVSFYDGWA
jgi:hypothetical protein